MIRINISASSADELQEAIKALAKKTDLEELAEYTEATITDWSDAVRYQPEWLRNYRLEGCD